MTTVALPSAQSLLAAIEEIAIKISYPEGAIARHSYSGTAAGDQVMVVASGLVDVLSVTIDPLLLTSADLPTWLKSAATQAINAANDAAKLNFQTIAPQLTMPALPAPGTLQPPQYAGFGDSALALIAQADGIEPQIRAMVFEGTSGPIRAVVDGQLKVVDVSFVRDRQVPSAPPSAVVARATEIGIDVVNALNEALDKAKNLGIQGVNRVVDAVAGRKPVVPALFVADSTVLNAADGLIVARLSSLGFAVVVREASMVQAADANGKALVVISESTASSNIGNRLSDVAVPMLVMEPALFDDLGMTGLTWQTDFGDAENQTSLNILDRMHFLAAGLEGSAVPVTLTGQKFVWGNPGPAAARVASLTGVSSRVAIFAYDKGQQMLGRQAPDKRIGWFLGRDTAVALTPAGWPLFDAAVRWATSARALFVVNARPLTASDHALLARISARHGLLVDVKTGAEVQATHAAGARLVVISESTESSQVGTRLRDVVAPMIVLEPALLDELKMTGGNWGTDNGDANAQQQLQILLPDHPLAAGYQNVATVCTANAKFIWGVPTSSAAKVAHIMTFNNRAAIFAYEKGASMVGGFPAPGRRVGWFAGRDTPAVLNSAGWAMFDAAVKWCVAKRCLLVVDQTPLTAADAAIWSRLASAFGLSVTVKRGVDVQATDANGHTLVFISETVNSGDLGTRLTNINVPIMCCEPALLDELKMTGTTWMTDNGDSDAQSGVQIVLANHPMAAGLNQAVHQTTQAPGRYVWGAPAAAAAKVAHIVGATNRWAIFGYDSGAQMLGMTAPAGRVGWFANRDVPTDLTEGGWALFDAAVAWTGNIQKVSDSPEREFVDALAAVGP